MAPVLVWMAEHGPATTEEVAIGCNLDTSSARGRLVMLKRQGRLSSRLNDAKPPRPIYSITAEGRRAAGISDACRPETT